MGRAWNVGMANFFSEGVCRVGGGLSVPRLLSSQKPEYTAEVRGARIEGAVDLLITIGQDGIPRNFHIQKGVGYGLDQKAR